MLEASDRSIVEATVRAHGDHELLTEGCSLLRAEQSFHEQQARRIEQEEKVAEFVETNRLLAVAESALTAQVGALVMELRATQVALDLHFLVSYTFPLVLSLFLLLFHLSLPSPVPLSVFFSHSLSFFFSLLFSFFFFSFFF